MSKKYSLLLTITLTVCLSFVAGCGLSKSQSTSNRTTPNVEVLTKRSTEIIKNENNYEIKVKLHTENKTLNCNEKINYVNNSMSTFENIYFHLYPNAYKTKETSPTLFGNESAIYPLGFTPGYLDIIGLNLNNKKADYTIEGIDKTILNIKLDKALKPGESIALDIDFNVTIPAATDRFGGYNEFFNFGNWYPIAAVYDESGWNLDPYYKIGDPFYSDIATYNVKIDVPKEYIVAATGEMISEDINNNIKSYTFKENTVRDFAWVASSSFSLEEKDIDGIKIKCYGIKSNSESNEAAMTAAVNSIKTFNKTYGKYPYKNYSVVCTNFPSGMEYPELVLIGKNYYDTKNLSYLEKVIVHETAHQWWYSTVGNDEVDEAWLDESLAAYSEAIFYEKKDNSKIYFQSTITPYNKAKASLRGNETFLKPVSKFDGWTDYGSLIYSKGPIMLNTLRDQIGDETFFKVMSTYYDKYKFKNAKTGDFIAVVEEVTGNKWNKFFQEWLLNKK